MSSKKKIKDIKPIEDIKPVEVKKPSKKVLVNISRGHHQVYNVVVAPSAIYEVTEKDLKDTKATKRIENAIKQGKLEWRS